MPVPEQPGGRAEASRAGRDADALVIAIVAPLEPARVAPLCARVAAVLDERPVRLVVCDVATVSGDLAAVDALARLALLARRRQTAMRLEHASAELQAIITLAGLADVLPCSPGSGLESQG